MLPCVRLRFVGFVGFCGFALTLLSSVMRSASVSFSSCAGVSTRCFSPTRRSGLVPFSHFLVCETACAVYRAAEARLAKDSVVSALSEDYAQHARQVAVLHGMSSNLAGVCVCDRGPPLVLNLVCFAFGDACIAPRKAPPAVGVEIVPSVLHALRLQWPPRLRTGGLVRSASVAPTHGHVLLPSLPPVRVWHPCQRACRLHPPSLPTPPIAWRPATSS